MSSLERHGASVCAKQLVLYIHACFCLGLRGKRPEQHRYPHHYPLWSCSLSVRSRPFAWAWLPPCLCKAAAVLRRTAHQLHLQRWQQRPPGLVKPWPSLWPWRWLRLPRWWREVRGDAGGIWGGFATQQPLSLWVFCLAINLQFSHQKVLRARLPKVDK